VARRPLAIAFVVRAPPNALLPWRRIAGLQSPQSRLSWTSALPPTRVARAHDGPQDC
jgi:hypothetical protein